MFFSQMEAELMEKQLDWWKIRSWIYSTYFRI